MLTHFHPLKTLSWFAAVLTIGTGMLTGCQTNSPSPTPPISETMFAHHFISQDLPTDIRWGYGGIPGADFDRDGDIDYGIYLRADSVYWFENRGVSNWVRHTVGAVPQRNLGGTVMDVDGDGWQDIVLGGFWYRNPGNPRTERFRRFRFDDRIENEIHDIVTADIDGDGQRDVVMMGDADGCFWYRVPENPLRDTNWPRTTITLEVLEDREAIHSGFFPQGVKDLDGDNDPDIVMPDRWYENQRNGTEWVTHSLPFGSRGPWGLSARSWITDLNQDGNPDIIMVDSDQQGSNGAWLENKGGQPPRFEAHPLPKSAPGTRGSFHSLAVKDFDGDGDLDIFTVEQEDTSIFPEGAPPRWYIWEQVNSDSVQFRERVIFNGKLGGHDAFAADIDGDGDVDILSKIWKRWDGNANQGREHVDVLENTIQ